MLNYCIIDRIVADHSDICGFYNGSGMTLKISYFHVIAIFISDIMNKGGICGIPTDVVYVLVAACKFPKSVEVVMAFIYMTFIYNDISYHYYPIIEL